MMKQLLPLLAVFVLVSGQVLALFFKLPWVLFCSALVGVIIIALGSFLKESQGIHWIILRCSEVVRYFMLWSIFPVIALMTLFLGSLFALGTIATLCILIYADRKLRLNINTPLNDSPDSRV